jgi:hypothetical protein
LVLDISRKHDLESLLYTMIYLFTGQCVYGEIDGKCLPLKTKIRLQIINRERHTELAKLASVTLGEYLVRNIDINSKF